MIDQPIFTIALLIVAGCNIATVWLYFNLKRKLDIEAWALTQDRSEHRKDLRELVSILVGQASTLQPLLGKIDQISECIDKSNQHFEAMRGDGSWTLDDLAGVVKAESSMTRQRIAQVKTRLADEEREDQAAKRRARIALRKGGR